MKMFRITALVFLLAGLAWVLSACQSGGAEEIGSKAMVGGMKPPFGGPEDMSRASSLWREMAGYKSWASYPGFEGWQDGHSPHGKVLRYYINGVAKRNVTASGAVIVKENYMMKGGPVLSITVMKKIPGYDRDNQNWFWVKYMPNGSVAKNPKGMSLAGRVAKGMSKGCIACHVNAGGDDMLFVNDE